MLNTMVGRRPMDTPFKSLVIHCDSPHYADVIDLCTIDGTVKELHKHGKANAARFFKTRELCMVVYVQS
jgi:hypothetical protein